MRKILFLTALLCLCTTSVYASGYYYNVSKIKDGRSTATMSAKKQPLDNHVYKVTCSNGGSTMYFYVKRIQKHYSGDIHTIYHDNGRGVIKTVCEVK